MIGNKIGHRLDPVLHTLLKKIFGNGKNPNLFTWTAFFVTLIASFFILMEYWILTGLAILLSGLFDLLDGAAARITGRVTLFGGLLDSVLDRYSDLFLMTALLFHYLKKNEPGLVILTSFVSIGIALIPYVRAKAEAAQIPCKVGLMERAERIILLSIGALFQLMEPILWIMVVLCHFTVLQRIHHVWKELHPPLKNQEIRNPNFETRNKS